MNLRLGAISNSSSGHSIVQASNMLSYYFDLLFEYENCGKIIERNGDKLLMPIISKAYFPENYYLLSSPGWKFIFFLSRYWMHAATGYMERLMKLCKHRPPLFQDLNTLKDFGKYLEKGYVFKIEWNMPSNLDQPLLLYEILEYINNPDYVILGYMDG